MMSAHNRGMLSVEGGDEHPNFEETKMITGHHGRGGDMRYSMQQQSLGNREDMVHLDGANNSLTQRQLTGPQ